MPGKRTDVISWDDRTILMAYNDTPETDWHERSPLTLAYSKDEGKTWTNLIELASAPVRVPPVQPRMGVSPSPIR